METLIMHPKNKEQSAALKAVAKALKIPFETRKDSPLPPHVMESVRLGLEQSKNGQTISLDEFKEKHL